MAGARVAAIMGGVALLGVVPFVLMSLSSDIEGQLEARGERFGSFTFEPDRCRSGQTLGFFGVELGSSADEERRIRLIRDSVEGSMVAYERAGQSEPPTVLRPQDCRTLQVEVIRTNNRVNSVYVVKGSATIDCDELSGTIIFDGCS